MHLVAAPSFLIREDVPNDWAYIQESWLNSYRSSARAQDTGDVYMRQHKALIRRILDTQDVVVRVAHVPEHVDAILGFLVATATRPHVLHYVFVRQGARRTGIARALLGYLPSEALDYTHRPMRQNGPMNLPAQWRYNPYRLP